MLGYLCLDGNEIANPGRTMAYLRNVGSPYAIGPNTDDCGWVDPPGTVYTTPWDDDAPWYDPADLRSRDFLGVWCNLVAVGSGYSRETTTARWGGSHGPTVWGPREVLVEGIALARSLAGAEYGRQWLTEALLGAACNGDCESSTLTVMRHCAVGGDDGLRYMHRVSLTSLQWIDQAPVLPRAAGMEFTATLTAGVPWVTSAPAEVFSGLLAGDTAECDLCGVILDNMPVTHQTAASLACGCVTAEPRRIPQRRRADCYVPPMTAYRQAVVIGGARQWLNGTLRVEAYGGSGDFGGAGLRNLRIRGYANTFGLTTADPSAVVASGDACVDIQIGCVPSGASLIVDGATRRAHVAVGDSARDGLAYLSSPSGRFLWPEVSCSGLILVIEADALFTSPDAALKVSTVEIERG